MIAVIQRVRRAAVRVNDEEVGRIERGLLILLGVAKGDTTADVAALTEKIVSLRVFADEHGKMNRSVGEVAGAVLVVSQFTLLADVSRGRRPSFDGAAPPADAERLYNAVVAAIGTRDLPVQTGRFGAMMTVSLENDGPVTFILDTRLLPAAR